MTQTLPSTRVSVQGVKSLGGHFVCLCRRLIIFIVKSLQKEQSSTNLLLWPPICLNKPANTPKWFNSLDTNSTLDTHSTLNSWIIIYSPNSAIPLLCSNLSLWLVCFVNRSFPILVCCRADVVVVHQDKSKNLFEFEDSEHILNIFWTQATGWRSGPMNILLIIVGKP